MNIQMRGSDAGPSRCKIAPIVVLTALLLCPVLGFMITIQEVKAAGDPELHELAVGKGLNDGDMYGASMVIADLDKSGSSNIIVGAPGSDAGGKDSGAIYVFKDITLDGNRSLDAKTADVTIVGAAGDMLGSALAILQDVAGDGGVGLAVGARRDVAIGKVVVFSGPTILAGNATPLFTVHGTVPGGGFGSSISAVGDQDGDGRTDMLVGEPGGDTAYVIFGDGSPATHGTNLWAWDPRDGQPVTFMGGVNNTPFDRNTFGLGTGGDIVARNDGWDWSDGIYGWVEASSGGGGGGAQPNGAYEYGAPEPGGPDADGVTQDGSHRLEVQIGPSQTGPGPSGTQGGLYSGAWGIQVQVTPEMWAATQAGATATVGFDWEAMDAGQSGSDDPSYIKARFGNLDGMHYLGQDLGGDAGPEIMFKDLPSGQPSWGPISDRFETDVAQFVTGPGWYYLDFGAVYDARSGNQRASEGIRAFFDNVTFRITGSAWSVHGPKGSRLGQSVLGLGDRSGDGVPDLAVGAPGFGAQGGAILVMIGPFERGWEGKWNASRERYLAPVGQELGTSLATAVLDADGLTDIGAGAPGADRVYLMSTSVQRPDWWPTLWDPDEDGVASFQNGFGKSGSTWGPGAGDDGWDTAPSGVYGGQSEQVRYNPSAKNSPDGVNRSIDIVKELEIELGGGNFGEQPATPASGAYGIQFDVPKDVIDRMTVARLRFQWHATDVNGIRSQLEEVWVKARFGTAGSMTELGTDLDAGSDSSSEIGYAKNYEAPGQKVLGGGYFETDVAALMKGPGTYYLELGGKVGGWGNPHEYMVVGFDDIGLEVGQGPPSFGPTDGPGFGTAVSSCSLTGKGQPSGLTVGSPDDGILRSYAGTGLAAMISGGPVPLANANYSDPDVLGLGGVLVSGDVKGPVGNSVDGAVLAGAPGSGPGAVVAIKMFQAPIVVIEAPVDGTVVNGTLVLRAVVSDPHAAIGNMKLTFSIRNDGPGTPTDWQVLGTGTREGAEKFVSVWDTSSVPNGDYSIKAEATDGLGPAATAIIAVKISNIQAPVVVIASPPNGSLLSGQAMVKALLMDLDMNMEVLELLQARAPTPPAFGDKSWVVAARLDGIGGLGPSLERELTLDTTVLQDGGPYWLSVMVTDDDGHVASDVGGPFQVWNPDRPSVGVISPAADETVIGPVIIRAVVTDPDRDIDARGARFYYRAEPGAVEWHLIGNDPSADADEYSSLWDPTGLPAQAYIIKVDASDLSGLVGEATVRIIKGEVAEGAAGMVSVELETPADGEMISGNTTIRARVAGTGWQTLVSTVCLQARPMSTGSGWSGVGCGHPTTDGTVEASWDTINSQNGTYEVRAKAQLAGGKVVLSPPVWVTVKNEGSGGEGGDGGPSLSISFLWPPQGEVLRGTAVVSILVDCMDRTGLAERVSSIHLLGSRTSDGSNPSTLGNAVFNGVDRNGGLQYSVSWDTNGTENGYVYIQAVVVDHEGRSWPSVFQGPVEVRNSPANIGGSGGGGGGGPVNDEAIVAVFLLGAVVSTVASLGAGWSVEIGKYQLLRWLAVPFMPLYSKIKREKLLDHVLRKKILMFINENPGDNFSSIRERMRLSNGSFAYHLWTLEREGFVVSRVDGKLRRFYPAKGIRPPKDVDGLNWFQLGLLDAIRRNEGLSLTELSGVMGESPQVLNYHLKVMTISGLVRKKRDGKEVRHYLGIDEDELEKVKI